MIECHVQKYLYFTFRADEVDGKEDRVGKQKEKRPAKSKKMNQRGFLEIRTKCKGKDTYQDKII